MRKGIIVLLAGLFIASNVMGDKILDYAAEDAGYEIIKSLSNRQLSTQKIAFLGLFGDRSKIAPVIEAEMTRHPGTYEFFARNSKDWDVLTSEIEFGDRKSDIMDKTTIQKFGEIKGVEALLYGDVREATSSDGKAIVRLTVKLGDVQTGEILWSGNIEGKYAGELIAPDRRTAMVVKEAAKTAAKSLAEKKESLGKVNIYLMPMNAGNLNLSDYVLPELTKISDANVKMFTGVAGQAGKRVVNKMAAELASSGIVPGDLKRISNQLDQLFEGTADSGEQTRDAILYGHFGDMSTDGAVLSTAVLNLHLADLATGQELWAETAEGRVDVDWVYVVREHWLYVLLGVIAFVIIGMFLKATRRVR